MKLANLLAYGVLAIAGVSALPTDDPKTPACQQSGNDFNGAGKECQCPPGQEKKYNKGRCGYPAMKYPQCNKEEKPYCAKNKNEYCSYDENNDYCEDDGKNKSFCCKQEEEKKCVENQYSN